MTKAEYQILLMLYVANIDGKIQDSELAVMLQKADPDTLAKMRDLFARMSEHEVLECIRVNNGRFASKPADREQILVDLRAIVGADERIAPQADYLCATIEKLLV